MRTRSWLQTLIIAMTAASIGGRAAAPAPGDSSACENLKSLSLPNVKVNVAQPVDAGASITADGSARAPRALCRVTATLTPSTDSDITMELWMPASGWNQKFQAVGNGAFNGSIGYPALTTAVTRGYAAASTDTGHTGNNARFALGHPERWSISGGARFTK